MEPTYCRRTVLQTGAAVTLVNLAAIPGSATPAEAAASLPDRSGPMRVGRFTVTIDDTEVPGWQSVTIPATQTEQGEYREGTDSDQETKLWGQTTVEDLEMVRGLSGDESMVYDWREAVRGGDPDAGRKDVVVTLQDEEGQPLWEWTFEGAWVKADDPPTLDATGDGDVATESVTVSFDAMVSDPEPGNEESGSTIQQASPESNGSSGSEGDGMDTEGDETDTEGENEVDGVEFSVEGPGFGIGSAVASLGALIYVLRRRLRGEE